LLDPSRRGEPGDTAAHNCCPRICCHQSHRNLEVIDESRMIVRSFPLLFAATSKL
jgi:hypothetical protein